MTILIWLGALAVLAVPLSALLPKSFYVTDALSQFVLQAAVGALVLLLTGIAVGVSGFVYIVLLLAYFLCVAQGWPYLQSVKQVDTGGAALKLLQINIWKHNKNTAPFLKLVAEEKPDVIVVAEVTETFKVVFESMADYPHRHIITDARGSHGISVLSKMPLEGLEVKNLAVKDIPSLFFTLVLGNKTLHVAALHAANPLHDLAARNGELSGAADWFEKEQPAHFLLTGDLNATPYCAPLKDLMKRARLRDVRAGRGFFGSWPVQSRVGMLRIPIDHVLVSESVKVVDFRLGADLGSDHLPTLTVIRL